MQDQFHGKGFFSLSVIPLGANLYLLEDDEEGTLKEMVEGGSRWLEQRFKEVRRWKHREVDMSESFWCPLSCVDFNLF